MELLNKAELDNSLFKAAVRGASGSGKTWWATAVAIGLHKRIGSTKPIGFLDTENALSYVLPHFTHNGIEVLELKSRAFKNIPAFFDEAEKKCDIVIIDSVTHLWEELISSFLKKKGKDRLAIWDWAKLKPEWRETFLNRLVNTPLHVICCGRISDIYEYIDVDGEKVLTTTGSKMSAEKNTEYEPSLTVELEKFTMTEEELKAAAIAQRGGVPNLKLIQKASRFRMTIIKDRANVLGGVYEFEPHPGEFIGPDNDIWLAVKPFCDALNIGKPFKGINLNEDSEDMFESPDASWQEREKRKQICLEEIEAELKRNYSSQKIEDKQALIDYLKKTFGTASWTAIKDMPYETLLQKKDEVMKKFSLIEKLENIEVSGADVVPNPPDAPPNAQNAAPETISSLQEIYRKSKVSQNDLFEAINTVKYDLGKDEASIRGNIKTGKYSEYKIAVGKLIEWGKQGR